MAGGDGVVKARVLHYLCWAARRDGYIIDAHDEQRLLEYAAKQSDRRLRSFLGIGRASFAWIRAQQAQVDARPRVECDEDCGAYQEPDGLTETMVALRHWRDHSVMAGCSHGC